MSESAVTIYHNPRCSKSRQTLKILEDKGLNPNIVLYLKTPPSAEQLANTVRALGIAVRDILRTSETAYNENNLKDRSLSDQELIDAMVANPILIERPIVLANDKARIGRPPESVLEIL